MAALLHPAWALLHLLFALLPRPGRTFNLDTHVPLFKFGDAGTLFGYSVALHKVSDLNQFRLLVGAPKAESEQVGTVEAGALFSCPFTTVSEGGGGGGRREEWCRKERVEYRAEERGPGEAGNASFSPEDFYRLPPNHQGRPSQFPGKRFHPEGKNGQLLGASLSSGGGDGDKAVVCAPLARFEAAAYADGVCYLLKNSLEQDIYIHSCQNAVKKERFQDYGACTEGVSATISRDYATLVTGLTGAKNWKGGLSARGLLGGPLLDTSTTLDTVQPLSYVGQHQPLIMLRPDEIKVRKEVYLGYSTGIGRFGLGAEGEAEKVTLVGGAPRLGDTGAVLFSSYDSEDYRQHKLDAALGPDGEPFRLQGGQVGGSFGAALAVADLDSDGFDDLLVGAPFEWGRAKDSKREWGGAVYVYFAKGGYTQDPSALFHAPLKLQGSSKHSHFGLAIAALGDINGDGNVDFAVGAPNAGESGEVLVFHGGPREDMEDGVEPAQVVRGSELGGTSGRNKALRGFGFSLSGGVNVDGEAYADLLVGSALSDAAVLLRTRPIVFVRSSVTAEAEVDKDANPCQGGTPSWAQTCIGLTARLQLSEREESGGRFERDLFRCRLEVVPSRPGLGRRARFAQSQGSEVFQDFVQEWPCGRDLHRQEHVRRLNVYLPRTNRDWLNDLKFTFSVEFADPQVPRRSSTRAPTRLSNFPVLDQKGSSSELTLKFNKKCGNDEVCSSDLKLRCMVKNMAQEAEGTYVQHVGNSTRSLEVHFTVNNAGERAYESQLWVTFDGEELERPSLIPGSHRLVSIAQANASAVSVNLGNPLAPRGNVEFALSFDLFRGRSAAVGRPLLFKAHVNSTSAETLEEDNHCELRVKVIKKAELRVSGTSTPHQVLYGGDVQGESGMEFEEDIGPHVYHNYTVTNDGPWGVSNLSVEILWPYEVMSPWPHGQWALYLMERPVAQTYNPFSEGGAVWTSSACTVAREVEVVNPLELKLNTIFSVEEDRAGRARRVVGPAVEEERRRDKRQLRITPEVRRSGKESVKVLTLSCEKGTAKCARIRCAFPYLEPRQTGRVVLRARLWNSTFVQHYYDVHEVELVSKAELVLDPAQGVSERDLTDNVFLVTTKAIPDRPQIPRRRPVPYWIVVLAVVGGVFLLFLIVLLCWKCGFFKRHRRHDNQLYRAEFHHGEEDWTET